MKRVNKLKLKLGVKEAHLVRLALADTIANSDVLEPYEKEYLAKVYRRLRRYENRKINSMKGRNKNESKNR